jgi:hypothetical protein
MFLLSGSANALKLCNVINDPNISYVDLHKLHKQALPKKFVFRGIAFFFLKYLTIRY